MELKNACLLHARTLGSVLATHGLDLVLAYIFPAFGRWEQRNHEFKVILSGLSVFLKKKLKGQAWYLTYLRGQGNSIGSQGQGLSCFEIVQVVISKPNPLEFNPQNPKVTL